MPFDKYNVGCYLLDRLAEVGVQDIFGVPGDFNLRFLDDLMTHPVNWIGSANELNAAYAADGYARQRGIGALVTTYGVGELSAANGVAGAYAESVPIIHIVGIPAFPAQHKRLMLHHSLGDGDFYHFVRVSKEFCCAAEMLTPENARRQIDHVITEVLYHKKPGYIALPMDVAELSVAVPAAELIPRLPVFSECSLDELERVAAPLVQKATSACVLVGHLVERYHLCHQMNKFVEDINIPYAVAALGKGVVDENRSTFIGSYIPGISPSPAQAVVETSDLLITFGVELTDLVTAGFRQNFPTNTIEVHPFEVSIGEQRFCQIPMHKAFALLEDLCKEAQNQWKNKSCEPEFFKQPADPKKFDLTHMWREIQKSLRPNDIVLADMGTSSFSSCLLRLPPGCRYVAQNMYGSIGYTLPAALGCQVACRDRRVICIIGDGGAQMTAQELGTVARHNLPIQYVLVNNYGYTIERYIRGMNADYNDIASWSWEGVARSMAIDREPSTCRVESIGQVEKLLSSSPESMQLLEVIIDKYEAPLRDQIPLPLMKKN